jgi:hypothetical protein
MKSKTIRHRSDNQAGEGERERRAAELQPPASDPALRAKQYQQVKSHHRGRQHHRQGHDGFDKWFESNAGIGQPPREWCADQEQNNSGQCRQFDGEQQRS